jgi:hypothetical protein
LQQIERVLKLLIELLNPFLFLKNLGLKTIFLPGLVFKSKVKYLYILLELFLKEDPLPLPFDLEVCVAMLPVDF